MIITSNVQVKRFQLNRLALTGCRPVINKIQMKHRIFINTSDIMVLRDISDRHARRVHAKIIRHFKKEPHQLITVREYALYYAITETEVYQGLDIKTNSSSNEKV